MIGPRSVIALAFAAVIAAIGSLARATPAAAPDIVVYKLSLIHI